MCKSKDILHSQRLLTPLKNSLERKQYLGRQKLDDLFFDKDFQQRPLAVAREITIKYVIAACEHADEM